MVLTTDNNNYSNDSKYEEYFKLFKYELSPFQKHAIQGIVDGNHVLVTAATGSGKTLPAEFAIRHLADATELLTVAVLRRTLPDVSAEFKLHLSAARSAVAGDHGQDVLLAWLQAAGVTLAGGVTAQLELPGF